jgi:N-acylneuraminate cytidylyltransferase
MNIALIPARSGSKSIKNKNIKLFLKKPLIYWSLLALENSRTIDQIFIAIDDNKYEKIIRKFNFKKVKIFNRSKKTSKDSSQTEEELLEFINKKNLKTNDYIFLVQPTNPYVQSHEFDKAYKLLRKSKKNSLLSTVHSKVFFWNKNGVPLNYDLRKRPRRQNNQGIFIENGAFYINTVKNILKTKNRLTKPICIFKMQNQTLLELDEPNDWILGEFIKRNFFNDRK